jgi:hypothetical protein
MSLHGRAAYRTRRRAPFSGRLLKSMDFVHRPGAKTGPLRVIAASQFLAPAAERALGMQRIIAAVEFMQFELEQPVVERASDRAVLPEPLHDLMRLFC